VQQLQRLVDGQVQALSGASPFPGHYEVSGQNVVYADAGGTLFLYDSVTSSGTTLSTTGARLSYVGQVIPMFGTSGTTVAWLEGRTDGTYACMYDTATHQSLGSVGVSCPQGLPWPLAVDGTNAVYAATGNFLTLVYITTAADEVATLTDDITAFPPEQVDPQVQSGLLAKADAAMEALDKGNPNAATVAINDLKALVNQTEAQEGKKITPEAADRIIDGANTIIAAIQAEQG